MALFLPFQRATIAAATASAILAQHGMSRIRHGCSRPEHPARHRRRLARAPGLPRACRSRFAAPAGGRRTRSSASPASCSGCGRPSCPTAVFVGWDTLDVPTYRHEALPGYQARTRVRQRAARAARRAAGARRVVRLRVRRRRRATRPTTSSPPRPRSGRGRSSIATSDRDAFQLVSDRVSILQPVKGVSELARIGPAEVRERYGVDPGQVVDFIALRGDALRPHPGRAGRRPEDGRASLLAQYGSARRGARGRALLGGGRQPAALPAHRADGRRRRRSRSSRRRSPTGPARPRMPRS